ncbi:MAG: N-alpha-acetyl diaminobutyric acid deacetylase DoeB, partial [Pseudomonadota bacterium]
VLIHAKILRGEAERARNRRLHMPSADCFTTCAHDGLLEPAVDLGDAVAKGDLLARIWPMERTGTAPHEYRARMDGILAGRHFPGRVAMGDCLAVQAVIDD